MGGVRGLVTACWVLTAIWVPADVAEASVTTEPLSTSPSRATAPVSARRTPPKEAQPAAAILQRIVELFSSAAQARERVTELHKERDELRTRWAVIGSEHDLNAQQQVEMEQQLASLQQRQQQQANALRKDLESRLESELQQTRRQLSEDSAQEFARKISAFENRQRETIERTLTQDVQMKERELEQLSREVKIQTDELLDRLSQLETDPHVTTDLQRSTAEALSRRKADLDARRAGLTTSRDAEVTKWRTEYVLNLKQQQELDQQQRLTLKEASLRQSMAQLLQQARDVAERESAAAQRALEDARARPAAMAKEQAEYTKRLEALECEATAHLQRAESLDAERHVALGQLEETLQRASSEANGVVLSWVADAVQQLPPALADEVGYVQQRVVVWAQQEQVLRQQREVLRQRQLALHLAHEMEAQHRQAQLKRQREAEAKAKRVDQLLGRAMQCAQRGKFDDALGAIAQAQALNPAGLDRVSQLREEILAAKDQQSRQAQLAQIQDVFAQAMKAFEQGRYEHAITLFEQVIAQESSLHEAVQVAEGDAPLPQ